MQAVCVRNRQELRLLQVEALESVAPLWKQENKKNLSMAAFDRFDRSVDRPIGSFDSIDSIPEKIRTFENVILGRIQPIVPDSFESESDSNEFWDDRLNSLKSDV